MNVEVIFQGSEMWNKVLIFEQVFFYTLEHQKSRKVRVCRNSRNKPGQRRWEER